LIFSIINKILSTRNIDRCGRKDRKKEGKKNFYNYIKGMQSNYAQKEEDYFIKIAFSWKLSHKNQILYG